MARLGSLGSLDGHGVQWDVVGPFKFQMACEFLFFIIKILSMGSVITSEQRLVFLLALYFTTLFAFSFLFYPNFKHLSSP